MPSPESLAIEYRNHARIDRLVAVLRYTLEQLSLEFDRWEESRVYGPGMYLAVVVGPSVSSYADPMGANRWPDRGGVEPLADWEGFLEAAIEVAYCCDGAVVISVDGVVSPQLVRFRMDAIDTELGYEPWMGARHMSALDVSTREDVIATVTLSEETGRVTVFEDGTFESEERQNLGGAWRAEV